MRACIGVNMAHGLAGPDMLGVLDVRMVRYVYKHVGQCLTSPCFESIRGLNEDNDAIPKGPDVSDPI
jgi:hypothetical protein